MEEERQAREKLPDPRVPVVSRPTAARTHHMAARARSIVADRSGIAAEGGRLLVPHYPTSTLVSPVPHVLAEALAARTRTEVLLEGLRWVARKGKVEGQEREGEAGKLSCMSRTLTNL